MSGERKSAMKCKILAALAVAVAIVPQLVAAQSDLPFLKVDATSTPQFVVLNREGPAANDDILMGASFYEVIVKNDDTEECVLSIWRLAVSGTDTTWALPSPWTMCPADTICTLQPGDGARLKLNGADAIYQKSGLTTVVRQ